MKKENKIDHTETISFKPQRGQELKNKLKRLRKPEIITEIRFENCKINDDEMVSLCTFFKNLPNLKIVEFDYTKITEKGAKVIATWLTEYSGLEKLSLYFCYIGDAGIVRIAESLSLQKNLHSLYLNNNDISDKGAAMLSHYLQQGTSLKILELKTNAFGNEGARLLSYVVEKNPDLKIFLNGLASSYPEVFVTKEGILKPHSPDMLNPNDYEKHRVNIRKVTWKKTSIENMRFFFSEPEKLFPDKSKEKVEQQQDTLKDTQRGFILW